MLVGRPKSPSYTYRPAVGASNVAALPRAERALGHALVSELGLQYRHVAFSTVSTVLLVEGVECLSSARLLWLCTDRCRQFANARSFLHGLALLETGVPRLRPSCY
jgi:hypothetical protein